MTLYYNNEHKLKIQYVIRINFTSDIPSFKLIQELEEHHQGFQMVNIIILHNHYELKYSDHFC